MGAARSSAGLTSGREVPPMHAQRSSHVLGQAAGATAIKCTYIDIKRESSDCLESLIGHGMSYTGRLPWFHSHGNIHGPSCTSHGAREEFMLVSRGARLEDTSLAGRTVDACTCASIVPTSFCLFILPGACALHALERGRAAHMTERVTSQRHKSLSIRPGHTARQHVRWLQLSDG